MLGRRRHDLELGHRHRALPERSADAVRAGVAAADHDHMLAAGENLGGVAERLAADAAVLLRQEIHREVDAGEVAAGDRQVARRLPRRRSAPARHIASAARADRARRRVPPTWAP